MVNKSFKRNTKRRGIKLIRVGEETQEQECQNAQKKEILRKDFLESHLKEE